MVGVIEEWACKLHQCNWKHSVQNPVGPSGPERKWLGDSFITTTGADASGAQYR